MKGRVVAAAGRPRLGATGRILVLGVEHGHAHAAGGDQVFQPRRIVLRPSLQRDQKYLAAETDAPVQDSESKQSSSRQVDEKMPLQFAWRAL